MEEIVMPNRKAPVVEEIEDIEEYEEEMAPDFSASLTQAIRVEEKKDEEPRVSIFLPRLDDPGDGGIKVDQYEHVTMANEVMEKHDRILRGEHVEIPVSTFIRLKEKYPKL
jgi:hypothetical protein